MRRTADGASASGSEEAGTWQRGIGGRTDAPERLRARPADRGGAAGARRKGAWPEASRQPVTIEFWTPAQDPPQQAVQEQVHREFQARHPHITVTSTSSRAAGTRSPRSWP